MTIPGANLLRMALTIIAPQGITYYAPVSRALNDIGQYITTYAAPIVIEGSFQPVQRQLLQSMGLDLQKSYYVFYSSFDLQDVERDTSPGLLVDLRGEVLQIESDTDWFTQDGWKGVLTCYSALAVPSLVNGEYINIEEKNANLPRRLIRK